MRETVVHLTTVHPRDDTRIYLKEARTVAQSTPHRVVLLVADGLGTPAAPTDGVEVVDMGVLPMGRGARALVGIWRSLWAVRRLQPSVVHFHDPELLPLGFMMKALGIRVIYDAHENTPDLALHREWVPVALRRLIAGALHVVEAVAVRVFDQTVVATPRIARRFPSVRTALVQNFPIQADVEPRGQDPYHARPRSFAYVGAIAPERGAMETVRSIALAGSDVRLELAGSMSPTDLRDQLDREPGWDQVRYHGVVDRTEVMALLGRVRGGIVLFHPLANHLEAQPTKMFEYMAAGIPVIASDFPHWREIIDRTRCGLLVDPLDTVAIGRALRWVLENPAEGAEMGRRGRKAVATEFGWAAQSSVLLDAYGRLLPTTRPVTSPH